MPANRQLNSLAALTVVGLAGMSGAAVAAATFPAIRPEWRCRNTGGRRLIESLDFAFDDGEASLYTAGGTPVADTYTGTAVWTLVNSAGGIVPVPGVKNSSLLNYVVAVGSDGYEAVFRAASSTDVRRQFFCAGYGRLYED